MQNWTVIAESYDEENSQHFHVKAENQQKAWDCAFAKCADISENSGVYWTPVDVSKSMAH